MENFDIEDSLFYQCAIDMLSEAGHAIDQDVISINRSITDTVFFDTKNEIVLSTSEMNLLSSVGFVSHLFVIENSSFYNNGEETIGVYSITLNTDDSSRSKVVYETHKLVHRTLASEFSIIVFKSNEYLAISMCDYKGSVVLSDWYSLCDINDNIRVLNRLSIANTSLMSALEFYYDFVFSLARWYYIAPIESKNTHGLVPITYFSDISAQSDYVIDHDNIKTFIQEILREAEIEYGDDYVDPNENNGTDFDILSEIDMMHFELELDDNENDVDDVYDQTNDDFEQYENSEYHDLDPEIFNDPVLMVKWVEEQ